MNVVLINTSDSKGGAAIACNRLHKALIENNVNSKMLVQIKDKEGDAVYETANTYIKRKQALARFIIEKLSFLPHEKNKDVRFSFSLANTGSNISKNELIKSADIIHLHWVYQGFISLRSIQQLALLNKPIVWTFHDMWAFTGGCHYSGDCENYLDRCGNCYFLKKPGNNDISSKIHKKKYNILKDTNLTVVTCSNWLRNLANSSSMLKNKKVEAIPNPIEVEKYKPTEKSKVRNELGLPSGKILLGFVSFKVDDVRKGFYYLNEGLKKYKQDFTNLDKDIEVVIIGRVKGEIPLDFPYKIHYAGTITQEEEIIKYYNSLDVFLCPSLEDNLPNTIMEALACGVPALTFNIGGIGDMIDHELNGYLAEPKSIEDLANGLNWILEDQNRYRKLSENARNKVTSNFTNKIVGDKYLKLYQEIISK